MWWYAWGDDSGWGSFNRMKLLPCWWNFQRKTSEGVHYSNHEDDWMNAVDIENLYTLKRWCFASGMCWVNSVGISLSLLVCYSSIKQQHIVLKNPSRIQPTQHMSNTNSTAMTHAAMKNNWYQLTWKFVASDAAGWNLS